MITRKPCFLCYSLLSEPLSAWLTVCVGMLRQEVALQLHKHLLEKCALFMETDEKFLESIIFHLKPEIYPPSEFIITVPSVAGISIPVIPQLRLWPCVSCDDH